MTWPEAFALAAFALAMAWALSAYAQSEAESERARYEYLKSLDDNRWRVVTDEPTDSTEGEGREG